MNSWTVRGRGGYSGSLTGGVSDEACIRGFLDGDRTCVSQIAGWIGEVLRHPRLGLGAEAEDLGQQVQRKLLVSFRGDGFAGRSSLRTYVWRVAQHAAIDHLRQRRTKPPPVGLDGVREPSDPALTPEGAMLLRERRTLLARVLGQLGEDCRSLLQLIIFDELSYKAIAERLRASEGAIKVRALRCREKAAAQYRSVTSPPDRRPS